MKKTIAAMCVLFASLAVTAFADETGAVTQTDPTEQTADQKAEIAKSHKKQMDEQKAQEAQPEASDTGSSEQQK